MSKRFDNTRPWKIKRRGFALTLEGRRPARGHRVGGYVDLDALTDSGRFHDDGSLVIYRPNLLSAANDIAIATGWDEAYLVRLLENCWNENRDEYVQADLFKNEGV